MTKLRTEIVKILEGACPRVFFENASDDSQTPYLVYDFAQSILIVPNQLAIVMDVDIWDKRDHSENVESIEKSLRNLDKTLYIDEHIQFSMHYDRTINTKSEDKNWKRKTVTFEVRVMERS